MTLLTIVQDAAIELGFAEPSSVMTSTDPTIQLLRVIATKEGKELARRFDWQALQKEATFTTVATEIQVASIQTTYPFFGRIVNGSMWDRTENRIVRGPLTAAEWQMKKAATAQITIGHYFRIRSNSLLMFSTPPAGNEIYFEYISNKWCFGSEAQTEWLADSDFGLIDEELIRLGIVWRYRKAKGFDYGEDFRTYEMALQDMFGPDSGRSIVDMTGADYDPMGLGVNLSEGSWDIT